MDGTGTAFGGLCQRLAKSACRTRNVGLAKQQPDQHSRRLRFLAEFFAIFLVRLRCTHGALQVSRPVCGSCCSTSLDDSGDSLTLSTSS